MEALWTPLFSFMVFALIFAIGDVCSYKTKGLISGIIIGAIVYIGGYWSGIIPTTSVSSTGLPMVLTAFVIPLLITNLGTMISLEDMMKEWKTVVVSISSLVGLAIIAFTVGIALFGREYALSAAPPISGGTIAAILTKEAADAAGRPELGAFAMLVMSTQMFVGMPVSSFMLKREATRLLSNKETLLKKDTTATATTGKKKRSLKIFPELPQQYQTFFVLMAKLAVVATIAYFIAIKTAIPGSSPVNYILNPNIAYLLFGVLFCELGFLEKGAMTKAGCYGFSMIAIFSLTPNSFTTLTPDSLMAMVYPLVGMLLLGATGLGVFAAIMGKFLKYPPSLSIAIGMCALMGYPSTQIVTDDVCAALDASIEEKEAVKSVLLPKMLVGGFTSVTIASVAFAGIIAPMIFQ